MSNVNDVEVHTRHRWLDPQHPVFRSSWGLRSTDLWKWLWILQYFCKMKWIRKYAHTQARVAKGWRAAQSDYCKVWIKTCFLSFYVNDACSSKQCWFTPLNSSKPLNLLLGGSVNLKTLCKNKFSGKSAPRFVILAKLLPALHTVSHTSINWAL